ncbi:hypothetical protein D3C85_1791440 [compost metagenome]
MKTSSQHKWSAAGKGDADMQNQSGDMKQGSHRQDRHTIIQRSPAAESLAVKGKTCMTVFNPLG